MQTVLHQVHTGFLDLKSLQLQFRPVSTTKNGNITDKESHFATYKFDWENLEGVSTLPMVTHFQELSPPKLRMNSFPFLAL